MFGAYRAPQKSAQCESPLGPLAEWPFMADRWPYRAERDLHKLFCGTDPDDKQDRDKLTMALGVSDAAVAAAVATILGSLGLGAIVAGIVAAILIKRIIWPQKAVLYDF